MSLPIPDEKAFLDRLLSWGIGDAETPAQREAALQAIASIINRRPDGEVSYCIFQGRFLTSLIAFEDFLKEKLETFWSPSEPPINVEKRRQLIGAWTWVIIWYTIPKQKF